VTTSLPFTGFRPAALTFFRGLTRHNDKRWFEAHREQYETEVKQPLQLFVDEVDARLGVIAPEMVGHKKRSLFRIHRDIRFSNDKSPYKTAAACWFFHRDVGSGVGQHTHGGAGFYFQLSPKESFLGAGIWMPPAVTLKRLRAEVADDYETLEKILRAPAFRRTYGPLNDENVLTRPPRGYDASHPAAELLRHKSYMVRRDLTATELHSAKLPDIVVKHYTVALHFVRWLNTALGYRAATRR
jgi:uncharacterized protein (TIGR02453 family)